MYKLRIRFLLVLHKPDAGGMYTDLSVFFRSGFSTKIYMYVKQTTEHHNLLLTRAAAAHTQSFQGHASQKR